MDANQSSGGWLRVAGTGAAAGVLHTFGYALLFIAYALARTSVMIEGRVEPGVAVGPLLANAVTIALAALTWTCLLALLGIAYYPVMEVLLGGTVGKLVLGLKVVKENGAPVDWGASIIRTLLRIVDGLFVYLVAAIVVWTSPTKQRLGDRVAKTLVVKKGATVPTVSTGQF